jgi:betaine-homocysteine S-methyltransferase
MASRKGILERLKEGVVLGDGGYLLELEKRGYVQAGPFTPEVSLTHPEALAQLHREFLRSGAEVLQTLTFYASEDKLNTVGLGGKADDINRAAVKIAKQVAAEGDALVAGNISLAWVYDPKESKTKDRTRELFDRQIAIMKDGGVDFVIGETYSFLGEALLAVESIKKAGLPAMVTMSFEQKPGSYEGDSVAECMKRLEGAGCDIVGINCLRNPEYTLPLMQEVRDAVKGFVACQPTGYRTKPEAVDFTTLPEFPVGLDPLQLNRAEMGDYATKAKAMGIEFIGSCCGSVACHVKAMAKALGKIPASERQWRVDYGKPMSAYEQHGHKD